MFSIDRRAPGSSSSYSDDKGETWTAEPISAPGVNDHQTFFTGPPPSGNPLVTTTQDTFPNVVYYCVNTLAGCVLASADGRPTFPPVPQAVHRPRRPARPRRWSTSKGRVFLPYGAGGIPTSAVTENAGLTWSQVEVSPDVPPPTPSAAVAVDKADNVYYAWATPEKLPYMAVSRDHGRPGASR